MVKKAFAKKRAVLIPSLAPYTVWAVLFIAVPMVFVAYYAFTDNSFCFTTENILRFFNSVSGITAADGTQAQVHTYLLILCRSLKLAVISTVICLAIGYPLASWLVHTERCVQKILLLLLMIPMWMNFLIRTYAWMTILQDSGIVNSALYALGFGPVHVIGTETAIVIGMVYDYLPYMVLPIYSVMAKVDDCYIEAARDLGCSTLSVFKRVLLPLSMPGVLTGITMVMIPSISTFYISQKLGNGKFFLIGDAIEGQYVANNLHFAAAMALVLMVLLLLLMGVLKYAANYYAYRGRVK